MEDARSTLTFRTDDHDSALACRLLAKRLFPRHLHYPLLFLGVGAGLYFVGTTLAAMRGVRLDASVLVLAILAVWLGTLAMVWGRRKIIKREMQDFWKSRGPQTVTIRDSGLELESSQGRSTIFWPSIKDVVAVKDGLLISLGGLHYVPIPQTAFANSADKDAFLSLLLARVQVAKNPTVGKQTL